MSDNPENLTTVTGAVRANLASASEEQKDKKYGQQKWGMFETHYQRTKGITTEQSLQEIEDFAKHHGTTPSGLTSDARTPVKVTTTTVNSTAAAYGQGSQTSATPFGSQTSTTRVTSPSSTTATPGGSSGLSPAKFGSTSPAQQSPISFAPQV